MKVLGFYIDGHLRVFDISTKEKELALLKDICKDVFSNKAYLYKYQETLEKLLSKEDPEPLWDFLDDNILRINIRDGPGIVRIEDKWEQGLIQDLA